MKAKEKDAYLNLGHAIIFQAVRDYRSAYKKYQKNPNNLEYEIDLQEIERFFHSRLFGTITTIYPDILIKKLKEE